MDIVPREKSTTCGWMAGALLLATVVVSPIVSAASTEDAAGALLAAAASRVPADRFQSTIKIQYRATVFQGGIQTVVGDDSIVHKYGDGERLHIIIDLLDHLSSSGAVIVRPSRRELLFDSAVRTMWWYPADKPLSGTAQQSQNAKRTRALRLIADSDAATGCFLDGYVDGQGNILDLITASAAPLTVRQAIWNGMACSVVEAQTGTTHAAIWIAPTQGNDIVKFLVHRGDDAAGAIDDDFEATAFVNIDGKTFVRAGRSVRSWTDRETRAHWRETVDADRTELNLHPQFDHADVFTTRAVPNGMRCFLDDLPNVGVDFIWSNGKPVARAYPDLFDDLGRSVQRTMSGEVSSEVPGAAPMVTASFDNPVSNQGSDDGTRRIAQLRTVLAGAVAAAVLMFIFVNLWKRNRRAA